MRFYSLAQVTSMFTVSRTTIARWESENGFPKRVFLGRQNPVLSKSRYGERYTRRSNCRVGFPVAEVDEWASNRPRKPDLSVGV
jgi:predicted DNA-binding transcriptional regulator AlpA